MELEMSDEEVEMIGDIRDDVFESSQDHFDMTERQVSAHYRVTGLSSSIGDNMKKVQEEFGVSKEESVAMLQDTVEKACVERFQEDHDLTFSTQYVSADYENGRWSCTIMTNQT